MIPTCQDFRQLGMTLAARVGPALSSRVPCIADLFCVVVVEEAPRTAVAKHVVGQRLSDRTGVGVVTALGTGTAVLALGGPALTIARHEGLRQLRHEMMAKVGLAQLCLVLLCHLALVGVLVADFICFVVALLLSIPVVSDLVWILEIEDAPCTTVAKHLVGERALEEGCRCGLAALCSIREIVAEGA